MISCSTLANDSNNKKIHPLKTLCFFIFVHFRTVRFTSGFKYVRSGQEIFLNYFATKNLTVHPFK